MGLTSLPKDGLSACRDRGRCPLSKALEHGQTIAVSQVYYALVDSRPSLLLIELDHTRQSAISVIAF